MDSFVSHGIAFLVGTATGAAGAYFAEKFTDRRREKEGQRKEEERFLEVAAMMPDLVTEMRQDLSQHPNFRDFFVIDKGLQLWASKNSFVYSECDGNDYLSKVRILEGHGYVIDITPKNAPMFRMTEPFVDAVRKWKSA